MVYAPAAAFFLVASILASFSFASAFEVQCAEGKAQINCAVNGKVSQVCPEVCPAQNQEDVKPGTAEKTPTTNTPDNSKDETAVECDTASFQGVAGAGGGIGSVVKCWKKDIRGGKDEKGCKVPNGAVTCQELQQKSIDAMQGGGPSTIPQQGQPGTQSGEGADAKTLGQKMSDYWDKLYKSWETPAEIRQDNQIISAWKANPEAFANDLRQMAGIPDPSAKTITGSLGDYAEYRNLVDQGRISPQQLSDYINSSGARVFDIGQLSRYAPQSSIPGDTFGQGARNLIQPAGTFNNAGLANPFSLPPPITPAPSLTGGPLMMIGPGIYNALNKYIVNPLSEWWNGTKPETTAENPFKIPAADLPDAGSIANSDQILNQMDQGGLLPTPEDVGQQLAGMGREEIQRSQLDFAYDVAGDARKGEVPMDELAAAKEIVESSQDNRGFLTKLGDRLGLRISDRAQALGAINDAINAQVKAQADANLKGNAVALGSDGSIQPAHLPEFNDANIQSQLDAVGKSSITVPVKTQAINNLELTSQSAADEISTARANIENLQKQKMENKYSPWNPLRMASLTSEDFAIRRQQNAIADLEKGIKINQNIENYIEGNGRYSDALARTWATPATTPEAVVARNALINAVNARAELVNNPDTYSVDSSTGQTKITPNPNGLERAENLIGRLAGESAAVDKRIALRGMAPDPKGSWGEKLIAKVQDPNAAVAKYVDTATGKNTNLLMRLADRYAGVAESWRAFGDQLPALLKYDMYIASAFPQAVGALVTTGLNGVDFAGSLAGYNLGLTPASSQFGELLASEATNASWGLADAALNVPIVGQAAKFAARGIGDAVLGRTLSGIGSDIRSIGGDFSALPAVRDVSPTLRGLGAAPEYASEASAAVRSGEGAAAERSAPSTLTGRSNLGGPTEAETAARAAALSPQRSASVASREADAAAAVRRAEVAPNGKAAANAYADAADARAALANERAFAVRDVITPELPVSEARTLSTVAQGHESAAAAYRQLAQDLRGRAAIAGADREGALGQLQQNVSGGLAKAFAAEQEALAAERQVVTLAKADPAAVTRALEELAEAPRAPPVAAAGEVPPPIPADSAAGVRAAESGDLAGARVGEPTPSQPPVSDSLGSVRPSPTDRFVSAEAPKTIGQRIREFMGGGGGSPANQIGTEGATAASAQTGAPRAAGSLAESAEGIAGKQSTLAKALKAVEEQDAALAAKVREGAPLASNETQALDAALSARRVGLAADDLVNNVRLAAQEAREAGMTFTDALVAAEKTTADASAAAAQYKPLLNTRWTWARTEARLQRDIAAGEVKNPLLVYTEFNSNLLRARAPGGADLFVGQKYGVQALARGENVVATTGAGKTIMEITEMKLQKALLGDRFFGELAPPQKLAAGLLNERFAGGPTMAELLRDGGLEPRLITGLWERNQAEAIRLIKGRTSNDLLIIDPKTRGSILAHADSAGDDALRAALNKSNRVTVDEYHLWLKDNTAHIIGTVGADAAPSAARLARADQFSNAIGLKKGSVIGDEGATAFDGNLKAFRAERGWAGEEGNLRLSKSQWEEEARTGAIANDSRPMIFANENGTIAQINKAGLRELESKGFGQAGVKGSADNLVTEESLTRLAQRSGQVNGLTLSADGKKLTVLDDGGNASVGLMPQDTDGLIAWVKNQGGDPAAAIQQLRSTTRVAQTDIYRGVLENGGQVRGLTATYEGVAPLEQARIGNGTTYLSSKKFNPAEEGTVIAKSNAEADAQIQRMLAPGEDQRNVILTFINEPKLEAEYLTQARARSGPFKDFTGNVYHEDAFGVITRNGAPVKGELTDVLKTYGKKGDVFITRRGEGYDPQGFNSNVTFGVKDFETMGQVTGRPGRFGMTGEYGPVDRFGTRLVDDSGRPNGTRGYWLGERVIVANDAKMADAIAAASRNPEQVTRALRLAENGGEEGATLFRKALDGGRLSDNETVTLYSKLQQTERIENAVKSELAVEMRADKSIRQLDGIAKDAAIPPQHRAVARKVINDLENLPRDGRELGGIARSNIRDPGDMFLNQLNASENAIARRALEQFDEGVRATGVKPNAALESRTNAMRARLDEWERVDFRKISNADTSKAFSATQSVAEHAAVQKRLARALTSTEAPIDTTAFALAGTPTPAIANRAQQMARGVVDSLTSTLRGTSALPSIMRGLASGEFTLPEAWQQAISNFEGIPFGGTSEAIFAANDNISTLNPTPAAAATDALDALGVNGARASAPQFREAQKAVEAYAGSLNEGNPAQAPLLDAARRFGIAADAITNAEGSSGTNVEPFGVDPALSAAREVRALIEPPTPAPSSPALSPIQQTLSFIQNVLPAPLTNAVQAVQKTTKDALSRIAGLIDELFAGGERVGDTIAESDEDASYRARTNDARTAAGLTPLGYDGTLKAGAEQGRVDMHFGTDQIPLHRYADANGVMSTPASRAVAAGYGVGTIRIGENLASEIDDFDTVFSEWMASSAHRAVLLDPYVTEVGIGHGDGRWVLWTGKSDVSGAAAQAPAVPVSSMLRDSIPGLASIGAVDNAGAIAVAASVQEPGGSTAIGTSPSEVSPIAEQLAILSEKGAGFDTIVGLQNDVDRLLEASAGANSAYTDSLTEASRALRDAAQLVAGSTDQKKVLKSAHVALEDAGRTASPIPTIAPTRPAATFEIPATEGIKSTATLSREAAGELIGTFEKAGVHASVINALKAIERGESGAVEQLRSAVRALSDAEFGKFLEALNKANPKTREQCLDLISAAKRNGIVAWLIPAAEAQARQCSPSEVLAALREQMTGTRTAADLRSDPLLRGLVERFDALAREAETFQKKIDDARTLSPEARQSQQGLLSAYSLGASSALRAAGTLVALAQTYPQILNNPSQLAEFIANADAITAQGVTALGSVGTIEPFAPLADGASAQRSQPPTAASPPNTSLAVPTARTPEAQGVLRTVRDRIAALFTGNRGIFSTIADVFTSPDDPSRTADTSITRRGFLSLFGGAIGASVARVPSAESAPLASPQALPFNVRVQQVADATLYIHRSQHNLPNSGELLDSNAAAFETGVILKPNEYLGTFSGMRRFWEAFQYGTIDATPLAQAAASKNLPLYAVDLWTSDQSVDDELKAITVQTIVGAGFIASSPFWGVGLAEMPIERRQMLGILGSGTAFGVGTYLTAPLGLEQFASRVGDARSLGSIEGQLQDWSSILMEQQGLLPTVLTLRNLVMAEKITHVIADLQQKGITRPAISVSVGAAHDVGLGTALLIPSAERRAIIKNILKPNPIGTQLTEEELWNNLIYYSSAAVLKMQNDPTTRTINADILWTDPAVKQELETLLRQNPAVQNMILSGDHEPASLSMDASFPARMTLDDLLNARKAELAAYDTNLSRNAAIQISDSGKADGFINIELNGKDIGKYLPLGYRFLSGTDHQCVPGESCIYVNLAEQRDVGFAPSVFHEIGHAKASDLTEGLRRAQLSRYFANKKASQQPFTAEDVRLFGQFIDLMEDSERQAWVRALRDAPSLYRDTQFNLLNPHNVSVMPGAQTPAEAYILDAAYDSYRRALDKAIDLFAGRSLITAQQQSDLRAQVNRVFGSGAAIITRNIQHTQRDIAAMRPALAVQTPQSANAAPQPALAYAQRIAAALREEGWNPSKIGLRAISSLDDLLGVAQTELPEEWMTQMEEEALADPLNQVIAADAAAQSPILSRASNAVTSAVRRIARTAASIVLGTGILTADLPRIDFSRIGIGSAPAQAEPASQDPSSFAQQAGWRSGAYLDGKDVSEVAKVTPPPAPEFSEVLPARTQSSETIDKIPFDAFETHVRLVETRINEYLRGVLGDAYVPPEIRVIESDADSQPTGPVYNGSRNRITIDPHYFREFQAEQWADTDLSSVDAAVAHEMGHHLVNTLGLTDQISALLTKLIRDGATFEEGGRFTAQTELQADFLAGALLRQIGLLSQGDPQSIYDFMAAWGSDVTRVRANGFLRPNAVLPHGTGAARAKSVFNGMTNGDMLAGLSWFGDQGVEPTAAVAKAFSQSAGIGSQPMRLGGPTETTPTSQVLADRAKLASIKNAFGGHKFNGIGMDVIKSTIAAASGKVGTRTGSGGEVYATYPDLGSGIFADMYKTIAYMKLSRQEIIDILGSEEKFKQALADLGLTDIGDSLDTAREMQVIWVQTDADHAITKAWRDAYQAALRKAGVDPDKRLNPTDFEQLFQLGAGRACAEYSVCSGVNIFTAEEKQRALEIFSYTPESKRMTANAEMMQKWATPPQIPSSGPVFTDDAGRMIVPGGVTATLKNGTKIHAEMEYNLQLTGFNPTPTSLVELYQYIVEHYTDELKSVAELVDGMHTVDCEDRPRCAKYGAPFVVAKEGNKYRIIQVYPLINNPALANAADGRANHVNSPGTPKRMDAASKVSNGNSIGIELRHMTSNGDPSEGEIAMVVGLTNVLQDVFNIPLANVVSHYPLDDKAVGEGVAVRDAVIAGGHEPSTEVAHQTPQPLAPGIQQTAFTPETVQPPPTVSSSAITQIQLFVNSPIENGKVLTYLPQGFDATNAKIYIYNFGQNGSIADAQDRQRVVAQFEATGVKNGVLVITQQPDLVGAVSTRFKDPKVVTGFLTELSQKLGTKTGLPVSTFDAMPIVEIAYSGGFQPVRETLAAGKSVSDRVQGLIYLDAMYGDVTPVADWIQAHQSDPSAFFISATVPSTGTSARNEILKRELAKREIAFSSVAPQAGGNAKVSIFDNEPGISHADFVADAMGKNPITVVLRRSGSAPTIEVAKVEPPAVPVAEGIRKVMSAADVFLRRTMPADLGITEVALPPQAGVGQIVSPELKSIPAIPENVRASVASTQPIPYGLRLYDKNGQALGDVLALTKGAPATEVEAKALATKVQQTVTPAIVRLPFVVLNPDNPAQQITVWPQATLKLQRELQAAGLPGITPIYTRHYAFERQAKPDGSPNYGKYNVEDWKKILATAHPLKGAINTWVFNDDGKIADLMKTLQDAEAGDSYGDPLNPNQNNVNEKALQRLVLGAALRGESDIGYILAATENGHSSRHSVGNAVDFGTGPSALASDYIWRIKTNANTTGGNALAAQFASFYQANELLGQTGGLSMGVYGSASGHVDATKTSVWDQGNEFIDQEVVNSLRALLGNKAELRNNLRAIYGYYSAAERLSFNDFVKFRDTSVYARGTDGTPQYIFMSADHATSELFALSKGISPSGVNVPTATVEAGQDSGLNPIRQAALQYSTPFGIAFEVAADSKTALLPPSPPLPLAEGTSPFAFYGIKQGQEVVPTSPAEPVVPSPEQPTQVAQNQTPPAATPASLDPLLQRTAFVPEGALSSAQDQEPKLVGPVALVREGEIPSEPARNQRVIEVPAGQGIGASPTFVGYGLDALLWVGETAAPVFDGAISVARPVISTLRPVIQKVIIVFQGDGNVIPPVPTQKSAADATTPVVSTVADQSPAGVGFDFGAPDLSQIKMRGLETGKPVAPSPLEAAPTEVRFDYGNSLPTIQKLGAPPVPMQKPATAVPTQKSIQAALQPEKVTVTVPASLETQKALGEMRAVGNDLVKASEAFRDIFKKEVFKGKIDIPGIQTAAGNLKEARNNVRATYQEAQKKGALTGVDAATIEAALVPVDDAIKEIFSFRKQLPMLNTLPTSWIRGPATKMINTGTIAVRNLNKTLQQVKGVQKIIEITKKVVTPPINRTQATKPVQPAQPVKLEKRSEADTAKTGGAMLSIFPLIPFGGSTAGSEIPFGGSTAGSEAARTARKEEDEEASDPTETDAAAGSTPDVEYVQRIAAALKDGSQGPVNGWGIVDLLNEASRYTNAPGDISSGPIAELGEEDLGSPSQQPQTQESAVKITGAQEAKPTLWQELRAFGQVFFPGSRYGTPPPGAGGDLLKSVRAAQQNLAPTESAGSGLTAVQPEPVTNPASGPSIDQSLVYRMGEEAVPPASAKDVIANIQNVTQQALRRVGDSARAIVSRFRGNQAISQTPPPIPASATQPPPIPPQDDLVKRLTDALNPTLSREDRISESAQTSGSQGESEISAATKKGLASVRSLGREVVMQTELMKELRKEMSATTPFNPAAAERALTTIRDEYNPSPEFVATAEGMFAAIKNQNELNARLLQGNTPAQLFEMLTSIKPRGRINVQQGPGILIITTNSTFDMARALKGNMEFSLFDIIYSPIGMYSGDRKVPLIVLNDSIVAHVVNALNLNFSLRRKVLDHEFGHFLQHMSFEARLANAVAIESLNPVARSDADPQVQIGDEVLAFALQGSLLNPFSVFKNFLNLMGYVEGTEVSVGDVARGMGIVFRLSVAGHDTVSINDLLGGTPIAEWPTRVRLYDIGIADIAANRSAGNLTATGEDTFAQQEPSGLAIPSEPVRNPGEPSIDPELVYRMVDDSVQPTNAKDVVARVQALAQQALGFASNGIKTLAARFRGSQSASQTPPPIPIQTSSLPAEPPPIPPQDDLVKRLTDALNPTLSREDRISELRSLMDELRANAAFEERYRAATEASYESLKASIPAGLRSGWDANIATSLDDFTEAQAGRIAASDDLAYAIVELEKGTLEGDVAASALEESGRNKAVAATLQGETGRNTVKRVSDEEAQNHAAQANAGADPDAGKTMTERLDAWLKRGGGSGGGGGATPPGGGSGGAGSGGDSSGGNGGGWFSRTKQFCQGRPRLCAFTGIGILVTMLSSDEQSQPSDSDADIQRGGIVVSQPPPDAKEPAAKPPGTVPDSDPKAPSGPGGGGPDTTGSGGDAGGGGFLGGEMSLLSGLLQGVMGWFTGSQQDQQSASNTTPWQPTQPVQSTQPAQQVVGAITANPSLIDASSTTQLSWSSVGTDVSSSSCAVITSDFNVIKRGGQDGTLTSPIITESTRFGLVCNAHNATDKLLNETLVRVRGEDTDPPRIFASSTVSANVSGQSSAPGTGAGGTSGSQSGTGTQTGVSSQLGATPNDVRTCDPEQPIDSFIRCLCEAEPNPNGCAIPPGGLR